MKVDLAIVGGGPAGISAALEAKRWGLRPVLLEKKRIADYLCRVRKVDNFPPVSPISGEELGKRFEEALNGAGVETVFEEVREVRFVKRRFDLEMKSGRSLEALSVIIATGQADAIPKEYAHMKKLIKLTRDVTEVDVRGKDVLVYGGGDVAFDVALNLTDRGGDAAVFCRSAPKAKKALQDEAREKGIFLSPWCRLKDLEKQGERTLAIFEDREEQFTDRETDLVFFAVQKKPALPLISGLPKVLGADCFGIDSHGEYGLFFAGDVVRGKNRNVGVAVGDGISAAFAACRYLMGEMDVWPF